MKKQTIQTIQQLKQQSIPISVLTAYDASFAKLISEQGVEIILVGDSLGMVMQGHNSTVPVNMRDMVYHARCVASSNQGSLIIGDLPYMAYATEQQALANSAKLMQAGANMVKLEGGKWLCESVSKLVERGIPVCGHLGLTPQSVDALGGYKVQGRDESNAQQIIDDALALQQAGAALLVLECVPSKLAADISQKLTIPTIGIGAGNQTDGQVLVLQDMLGLNSDFKPKFVKNFFDEPQVHSVAEAISAYVSAVKDRSFPSIEHSFE